MLTPGKYNQLKVLETLPMGVYAIDNEQDSEDKVFIPYVSDSYTEGQIIQAFVYYNEDGELQGTCDNVKLSMGQFVSLKVKSIIRAGAFIDWGIKPDLFMPRDHLHSKVQENMQTIVTLFHDPYKKQLAASSKIEKYLADAPENWDYTQQVDLLIYAETPLGFKAIVDQKYAGLLYKSELFKRVRIGQSMTGFIKQIRSDGKIDLQLQRQDQGGRKDLVSQILDDLQAHDGISSLTDKSSPEDIQHRFNVSKNAYKKAIGQLYKDKKIVIHKTHISLV
ncbi:CvfB family protein [Agaribacter marinus]|uniref:GntR family transcriptional regulator n=1 Tax=Agaribacter marinus TaxID=1431249 RepID=A0AA37SUU5_9ALTE|nr:S1-like domain-containing RNA-binding protein [Agaribacter marinus]GLR69853.1 GntR family transcriptional regulator [Agaribacter marinus]